MSPLSMPPGWDVAEVNRWLDYHGEATKFMVATRTSLESRLVPISAYILISAVECYRRHPEILLAVDRAMRAEHIGAAGRRPGNQIDSVHLWSLANIFLHGRQILMLLGAITADHEPERSAIVLDFWKRAAGAFRGDGHLQAFDAGFACRPYPEEVVSEIVEGAEDTSAAWWPEARKLNAVLNSYLFLLYFDTRSGMVDTGPYDLGGGRVLLVRDFSKMGPSDFPWAVGLDVPYANLTAAFVLEDVEVQVNDWGTSIAKPEGYLDHVMRFGLFTTDDGGLRRLPSSEFDEIRRATKAAQSQLYRLVAGMSRTERIDAGAYVYFTFIRPFAEVAGAADAIDWTVPRDSLDVYEALSGFEGSGDPPASDLPYYWPVA